MTDLKGMTQKRVCHRSEERRVGCVTNRKTVERKYLVFLIYNEHYDITFKQFVIEGFGNIRLCNDSINYESGKVNCSVHIDESPKKEVSWL